VARHIIQEFRASVAIRAAVLVALAIWLGVLATAVAVDAPARAYGGIAFFLLFFLVFVAYYFSMSFTVHEYGLTYRGATEFMHVDWDEIVKVELSKLPLGGWYVTTKSGGFVLSSFLKDAAALAELVAARAGLMPQRA
jgi:hypothetical protein